MADRFKFAEVRQEVIEMLKKGYRKRNAYGS